jgi:trypsin
MAVAALVVLASATMVPPLGRGRVERETVPATLSPPPVRAASDRASLLRGERVLLVGDSLALTTNPYLGLRVRELGASYAAEAVGGSGLASPDFFDWKARAPHLILIHRPTIVVVEFCCNYTGPYKRGPDGKPILPGSKEFRELWAAEAAEFAKIVTAGGARLYWAVTPPTPARGAIVDDVNESTFTAALRADPPIRLLRWDLALTGGTGDFRSSIEIDGTPTPVRMPDQVHFTAAGSDLAARTTVDAILDDGPGRWGPFDRPEALAAQLQVDFAGPDDPKAAGAAGTRLVNGYQTVPELLHESAFGDRWGGPGAPLVRLHRTVRGSLPTDAWLRAAVARAAGGDTLEDEAAELLGSNGSADWADLDQEAFLDRLFERALGRPPDAADRSTWNRRTGDETGRTEAIVAVVRSEEAAEHHAGEVDTTLVFDGMLHRPPTRAELDRWAPEVGAGGADTLLVELLGSTEYAARLPVVRRKPVGGGVVGGLPVEPGNAPWMVSLVERGADPVRDTLCAGALIDPRWVVTTAACVDKRPSTSLEVVVGDTRAGPFSAEVIGVESLRTDPALQSRTLEGGPALLRLSSPARNRPIALAEPDENDAGQGPVSLVGWSQTAGGRFGAPHAAPLDGDHDDDCAAAYGGAFEPETMMCAGVAGGGVDACQGGAPVVVGSGKRQRLAGLTAWGVGCGRAGSPGVAMRLSGYASTLDLDTYVPPFSSSVQATTVLFQAVINRTPTPAELERWAPLMQARTVGPEDLVAWLCNSGETDTLPSVVRWWVAVTGKPPSLEIVALWRIALTATQDPANLIEIVLEDVDIEPILDAGDDRTFAQASYRSALGREPTAAELTKAAQDLRTGRTTRSGFVRSLSDGDEGRARLQPSADAVLVTTALFRRQVTDEEYEDWVDGARSGTLTRDRVRKMLRSPEFVDQY